MQLFIVVLVEGMHVPAILQNFSDHNYHGSVLSTRSIHHALIDSMVEEHYFGGLNKVVNSVEESSRPMILVVVKKDEEVKKLSQLVNETLDGIKGKGFMYSVPVLYLEGLDE